MEGKRTWICSVRIRAASLVCRRLDQSLGMVSGSSTAPLPRDAARFSGIVHESLQLKGKPGRLDGDLLHYTIQSFSEHEEKVERYTTLAARQMYAAGKRSWRAAMWLATPWNSFDNYVLHLGFLDGSRGWVISRMAARSTWLKFKKLGKLIEAGRRAGGTKTP